MSKGVITTNPNGLTFNPNFDILYVSNYGGTRTLFQIPFNADGSPGATKPWVTGVGSGTFDGMAADECGNVYVADTGAGAKIIRISPDGKQVKTVISGPSGVVLHNFAWGRGKGWSEDKLYIASLYQGLFEANLGVRGKKYW